MAADAVEPARDKSAPRRHRRVPPGHPGSARRARRRGGGSARGRHRRRDCGSERARARGGWREHCDAIQRLGAKPADGRHFRPAADARLQLQLEERDRAERDCWWTGGPWRGAADLDWQAGSHDLLGAGVQVPRTDNQGRGSVRLGPGRRAPRPPLRFPRHVHSDRLHAQGPSHGAVASIESRVLHIRVRDHASRRSGGRRSAGPGGHLPRPAQPVAAVEVHGVGRQQQ